MASLQSNGQPSPYGSSRPGEKTLPCRVAVHPRAVNAAIQTHPNHRDTQGHSKVLETHPPPGRKQREGASNSRRIVRLRSVRWVGKLLSSARCSLSLVCNRVVSHTLIVRGGGGSSSERPPLPRACARLSVNPALTLKIQPPKNPASKIQPSVKKSTLQQIQPPISSPH